MHSEERLLHVLLREISPAGQRPREPQQSGVLGDEEIIEVNRLAQSRSSIRDGCRESPLDVHDLLHA